MLRRREFGRWLFTGFVCATIFAVSPTAQAQSSDDLGVFGQLQYTDATGAKEFIEGVELSIDDVGGATTDKDGNFRIPVSSPGEYSITLNTATLPEGVTLKDPLRTNLVVTVSENADQRIIFPLITADTVIGSPKAVSRCVA